MKKKSPDLEGMLKQVQQQLTYLDKKIDALMGQGVQNIQIPQPVQSSRPPEHRPSNDRAQRTMYKVVCADCRKECEVPFKPSGDRPVYCRECFGKRKAQSPFKPGADNRPREDRHFGQRPAFRHHSAEGSGSGEKKPRERKFYEKITSGKKRSSKGRKKR